VGAADGGFDAVAVVLLEHAEVFLAELVGDVFDGRFTGAQSEVEHQEPHRFELGTGGSGEELSGLFDGVSRPGLVGGS
jgi:hypothetical protein